MSGVIKGISRGTLKVAVSEGLLGRVTAPNLYEFVLPSDSSSLQKQVAQLTPIPDSYELFRNYPNPFNPSTTIRFALPSDAHVRLVIFDPLGREMAKLADGAFPRGYHSYTWQAQGVASGVYLARLQVTDELGKALFAKTNKLLLMK